MKTMRFNARFENVTEINPLFSLCDIYICYPDFNRNNSFISKISIDKALFSLKNIPIVGEYLENTDNFGTHGGKVEIKDGKVKYIETTKPYGVVPESAEFIWETVEEEDGTSNEYLVVKGAYLWTGRYEEAKLLIDQKYGQSMEVEIFDASFVKKDGKDVYEIRDFVFSALCILGIEKNGEGHVEPAFESASIVAYSLDKERFKHEFNQMIQELKFSVQKSNQVEVISIPVTETKWKCPHCTNFIGEKELYFDGKSWFHRPCQHIGEIIFSDDDKKALEFNYKITSQEGGKDVLEKVTEMLKKYNLTVEDLSAKEIKYEDYTSVEDLENKVKDVFEISKTEFSLTSEQLEDELRRELAEIETITEDWWGEIYKYARYCFVDSMSDSMEVIAWDCKETCLVGAKYTVQNDNVEIDTSTIQRYKINGYVPMNMAGDPDPEVVVEFAFVSKDSLDYQLKRKEAEMKNEFASEKGSIESKLSEKNDALLQLNEQFTALQVVVGEKNEKIQSLEQYSKEIEENKTKEKVDALFAKYSVYFKPEEIDELRDKQTSFEKFELFEKEVKSIACDRMVEQLRNDGKQFKSFVEVPKDSEESEENADVFTKLKNKLPKTKGE